MSDELAERVSEVVSSSPYYRKRFGVRQSGRYSVQQISELWNTLPPLTPEVLASNTFAFVVPDQLESVKVVANSSGTTGVKKIALHSTVYTDCEKTQNEYLGLERDSNVAAIGRYGSLSYVSGVAAYRELGHRVYCLGLRHPPLFYARFVQMANIRAIRSRPSFLRYLAHELRKRGIDPSCLGVRHLVLTDHGVGSQGVEALSRDWHASILQVYGSSEAGPIAFSCRKAPGLHVHERSVLVEVVNPSTGEICMPGKVGQILVSTLENPVMPLLRYQQGDLGYYSDEPCGCGLASPRLRLEGRPSTVFTIGTAGIRFYPERLLRELDGDPSRGVLVRLRISGEPGKEVLELTFIAVKVGRGFEKRVEAALVHMDRHLAAEIRAGHVSVRVKCEPATREEAPVIEKPFVEVEDCRD